MHSVNSYEYDMQYQHSFSLITPEFHFFFLNKNQLFITQTHFSVLFHRKKTTRTKRAISRNTSKEWDQKWVREQCQLRKFNASHFYEKFAIFFLCSLYVLFEKAFVTLQVIFGSSLLLGRMHACVQTEHSHSLVSFSCFHSNHWISKSAFAQ